MDYSSIQLRKMFGKPFLPKLSLTRSEISAKVREAAGKLSISGVQPKLSLILQKDELLPVFEKGQYILKPQTEAFSYLPENEALCMSVAEMLGIDMAPNILIRLKDDSYAFLVKRFDRLSYNRKIQSEDFSQILGKDKYDGSYEQIGKFMKDCPNINLLQSQYLFERIVINFLVGNADAHLKNFSLLTKEQETFLSPAYDIVSSRLAIPEEKDETALTLCGKKRRILGTDFIKFGLFLGVIESYIQKYLDKCINSQKKIVSLTEKSLLPENEKKRFIEISANRISALKKY